MAEAIALSNKDIVLLAGRFPQKIPDAPGFAIQRKEDGIDATGAWTPIPSWVASPGRGTTPGRRAAPTYGQPRIQHLARSHRSARDPLRLALARKLSLILSSAGIGVTGRLNPGGHLAIGVLSPMWRR
jgi:hypothetical protein